MKNTILQYEYTSETTVTLGDIFTPRLFALNSDICDDVTNTMSHFTSCLIFVTTRSCRIIAFKQISCDSGMDCSVYLYMPGDYSERMDSCHSQLSDIKFHAMLTVY